MFEKSLYDLIKGLRHHKGNENDYIQHSLRECRLEIRGADMDLKATALLKLIYLEMFGHDMSWASFHALEVMSSSKYLQKRVGYLAAIQSFRQDTEVLMLITNLLKKDVSSVSQTTISLPLLAIPHIISPPLALSLLSDILPRLSHTSPNIRKKAIATLYRLALAYPDSLKTAWPKIKDLLMDDEQDSSVTAAIINVICELGWRRPGDFLALAPRFFEFLVEGGNNWMVIKVIKLFASLTPLEPRLVKKILPPLTSLIRTTPAMSVLYECINGIIQGGVLDNKSSTHEVEEIATLCVSKLRSMIMVDGDPNLKYVALLAFDHIIRSHPHLISTQEDIIMGCIDDADVSIRLKALDLCAAIVNSESLMPLVTRLLQQLQGRRISDADLAIQCAQGDYVAMDDEKENPGRISTADEETEREKSVLSTDDRINIIRYIIKMCSTDGYNNINDFEWYIEVLLCLFKLSPTDTISVQGWQRNHSESVSRDDSLSYLLGWQLRDVAVRVEAVRSTAVAAAAWLLSRSQPSTPSWKGSEILAFAAWIAGEYIAKGNDTPSILDALLSPNIASLAPNVICSYLQAIPKVYAHSVSNDSAPWSAERRTMLLLQTTRIIHVLEPLTSRSELEVQERAVGFQELFKIASQALQADTDSGEPLLLTKALPHLFHTYELNPVAPSAQRRVPLAANIDLDACINPHLPGLLKLRPEAHFGSSVASLYQGFYRTRPIQATTTPLLAPLPSREGLAHSYQQPEGKNISDIPSRRGEHDEPFYISDHEKNATTHSPLHEVLQNFNGTQLDIDAIPIMHLDLEQAQLPQLSSARVLKAHSKQQPSRVQVAPDLTIEDDGIDSDVTSGAGRRAPSQRKHLLGVDSQKIGSVSLINDAHREDRSPPNSLVDDFEMSRAIAEVERLRLEMQRASDRVEASDGTPADGLLVKPKKRRQPKNGTSLKPLNHHLERNTTSDQSEKRKKSKKKKRRKSSEFSGNPVATEDS